ncbi:MAG TPA: hypothetical protein VHX92_02080 [Rhizomicrobium sp.]|jgi:hypothetical protein|nr:hypothetical protein [Rhizomicrobium sp.]
MEGRDKSRFPWRAVRRGFFLAPAIICGLLSIPGFYEDLTAFHLTAPEALGHELFVFVYFVIGCYVVMLVIAMPLYFLGWKYLRVNVLSCLISGAAVGGVPAWTFFALQYLGLWPMYDSESLGGRALIANHKFTAAGIEQYLMNGVGTAAFGASIAFLFWLITIRNNPLAQSRYFPDGRVKPAHGE